MPGSEVLLTAADHGRPIAVAVGTQLKVRLAETPTTGYTWVAQSAGEVLRLLATDFAPAAPGAVGGGGLRSFLFAVAQPGQTTLRLKRLREWEGEASTVDEFAVAVDAHLP